MTPDHDPPQQQPAEANALADGRAPADRGLPDEDEVLSDEYLEALVDKDLIPSGDEHLASHLASIAKFIDSAVEEVVLGGVLRAPKWLPKLREQLRPEDFWSEFHAQIWRAILAVHDRGEPVDSLSVGDELARAGVLPRGDGRTRLEQLQDQVQPSELEHLDRYARYVAWLAKQRWEFCKLYAKYVVKYVVVVVLGDVRMAALDLKIAKGHLDFVHRELQQLLADGPLPVPEGIKRLQAMLRESERNLEAAEARLGN